MFQYGLRLALCCISVSLAAQPLSAVTIKSVLPFTPAVDAVRIRIRLAGDEQDGMVSLTGSINAVGADEPIWTGSLGSSLLTANNPVEIEQFIERLPVQAWSPGSPQLYELNVVVRPAGRPEISETVRFGFRTVESRNGNVYLNGKPIFLRGLAINPPGRTVPAKVGESRQFAYDYVKYLRGQHVNLIRLEHDSQVWFDVCDELGMMVYQGFYHSPPTGLTKEEKESRHQLASQDEAIGKVLPTDFESSLAAYREQFETYVRHPSIVIYILSNELPYKGRAGKDVHQFLTRVWERLRDWDATRLYIGNAGYGEGRQGDINDVHRYWGWYYNTFLTYYNLRDPKLFGDAEKNQPFTLSECVGNFTGPNGAYNCIEKKQLAASLGWTGTAPDQAELAQRYQAFMVREACESFRRMRSINPRLSGIMPFTITFHNWRGVQKFDEMMPTAAARQFGISYQPVLLSWENWQPQVYSGSRVQLFAHVVNDAEDFQDLEHAQLRYELRRRDGTSVLNERIEIPPIAYYGTWRTPLELNLASDLATGDYVLVGTIEKAGETISTNRTDFFIAGTEWRQAAVDCPRRVLIYDPNGDTVASLTRAQIIFEKVDDVTGMNAARDCLVIGQEAWNQSLTDRRQALVNFVRDGGRVVCFGQRHNAFDSSWLPAQVTLNQRTVNDPEYMTAERPSYEHMHVNPQRPGHAIFRGVGRAQLRLWSDETSWDQTQSGFPRVYPVQYGFRLTNSDDLERVAVLADYDAGLQGVALCEMFDRANGGSVLLCGLDAVRRLGVDPVADRLLRNIVTYMADETKHLIHPQVTEPIRWGDYSTHQGVLSGPFQGLFCNTIWVKPPSDAMAKPTDKNSGWNIRPSDQFVPQGIRPRGPFRYTFACGVRDGDGAETGTGCFWVTVPENCSKVISRVHNPLKSQTTISVEINRAKSTVLVPAGESVQVQTPLGDVETSVQVRYSGHRELIVLETAFE